MVDIATPPRPDMMTEEVKGRSLWTDARHRLFRNRAAALSIVVVAIICVLTIIAPLLSPFSYDEVYWDFIDSPPSFETGHIFGTDQNGRDLFLRTLYGGRVSLTIGLVATLVSLVIGVVWGAVAGYAGGKIDDAMMRFVDILYSIPFIFFVIMLTVVFGRYMVLMYAAIGAVSWLDMARIVRGQTLSLKRKEFVEAAHAAGVSSMNIIRRHIVPNTLGPVIIYVTLTVPTVILTESFISFLGMGVQEPDTSWGVLISEGTDSMENSWWALVFPCGFLAVTLMCLNFIGDGLRDALDPKDR
jgi:oligopeptide transport system permease protein